MDRRLEIRPIEPGDKPGELMATLLLCYDGSSESRHAVVEAARLFPGARAIALNVWGGRSTFIGEVAEPVLWAEVRAEAQNLVREAAELADAHGLVAEPVAAPPDRSVVATVLQVA